MSTQDFMRGQNIVPFNPGHLIEELSFSRLLDVLGRTCFEARNVKEGGYLLRRMISGGDTIWLGIAGAGIAGGLGGYVIELIKGGFVDVICTTGAQAYHDLHFACGFPVKQGSPKADDNVLRQAGVVRIHDIYIEEKETLRAQDIFIQDFCRSLPDNGDLSLSTADFNFRLGDYVLKNAPFAELSFLAQAAAYHVPVFYDSGSNHSIGMNLAALTLEGIFINLSASLDVLESAAIAYSSKSTGFFELGGGGPKNFIQQTGPTIAQVLGIDFDGANRGLQITTAPERDGSLSGCTFSEGVTWGKYRDADRGLVQISGEYSIIFPLLAGYALENCKLRSPKELMKFKAEMLETLKAKANR